MQGQRVVDQTTRTVNGISFGVLCQISVERNSKKEQSPMTFGPGSLNKSNTKHFDSNRISGIIIIKSTKDRPRCVQRIGAYKLKKLILVTSPPASGKTYVAKKLAEGLSQVVYLDKDTLIPLSKQIFVVAGEEYNRSSDFFEKNIRDYEYETIVALALEALDYDNTVLINAPFTEEIRDIDYICDLKAKLIKKKASLVVIWVETAIEVTRQRMIARNSERDIWKISHWDDYIAGSNFDIPIALDNPQVKDDLLIFKNSTEAEFKTSLTEILSILE